MPMKRILINATLVIVVHPSLSVRQTASKAVTKAGKI